MEKHSLRKIEAELKEIIRIEQVMKYSLLTPGDVISLKKLAEKGLPRAEFLYSLMLLERRNEDEAIKWLQRCKRHANGLFLWKLSRAYAFLGEKWHKESLSCLRRAAWRKYPPAMKLIKELKKLNYYLS
jgi:TPR repeat protein